MAWIVGIAIYLPNAKPCVYSYHVRIQVRVRTAAKPRRQAYCLVRTVAGAKTTRRHAAISPRWQISRRAPSLNISRGRPSPTSLPGGVRLKGCRSSTFGVDSCTLTAPSLYQMWYVATGILEGVPTAVLVTGSHHILLWIGEVAWGLGNGVTHS